MILIYERKLCLVSLMNSIVRAEETPVPEDVIAEYMKQDIIISNPLLDYAYSRQDVENMVIATTRSHKDSEEYSLSTDEIFFTHSSSIIVFEVMIRYR